MITLINNDSHLEIMNFPDGEGFVKFDYNNKPINILWRYENDAEIMILAEMYSVMKRRDNKNRMPKNLFIPYLPHSRQDRAATDNQPFSLAVFANILEAFVQESNTNIYTLDIHSQVLHGLHRARQYDPTRIEWEYIDSSKYSDLVTSDNNYYDAVICPDKGATRRATLWYESFLNKGRRVDYIQCTKVRDPNTGKLSEPELEKTVNDFYLERLIKARKALLVDDIGTGFGTHIQLGNVLKKINPYLELDLFVSHSSFTRGKDIVLEVFNKVYTTDSLPQGLKQESDRIIRFDCTEFLPKV